MNIQVAARRRSNQWRGAVIVDGEFEDSLLGGSLAEMIADAVAPTLMAAEADSDKVTITINVQPRKQAPEND